MLDGLWEVSLAFLLGVLGACLVIAYKEFRGAYDQYKTHNKPKDKKD